MAAGLASANDGHCIRWPEPGHGATCKAWSRHPRDAMKAVWEVANRLAWDERTVTEWLADADAHPVEVEDFLGTQDPTPKSNGDTAMPSMLGHKIGDESGRKQ